MNTASAIRKAYDKHQGGLVSFYRNVVKASDSTLSQREVEQILLRHNPNYYLWAQPTRVYRRNPVTAYNVGKVSVDLADFSKYKSIRGHGYIACAVDQFSSYSFLMPLTHKDAKSCLRFITAITKHWRKEFDIRVRTFGSDYEAGLRSKIVQEYVASSAAGYFFESQSGNTHNSVAESIIRLVGIRLTKCMIRDNVNQWTTQHVHDVQNQLNTQRRPRSLGGFTPLQVMMQKKGARETVLKFQKYKRETRRKEGNLQRVYTAGTSVRIRPYSGAGSYARKGRLPKWSDNRSTFVIHRTLKRPIPAYKIAQILSNGKRELLSSIFYNDEVIPVSKPRSV